MGLKPRLEKVKKIVPNNMTEPREKRRVNRDEKRNLK